MKKSIKVISVFISVLLCAAAASGCSFFSGNKTDDQSSSVSGESIADESSSEDDSTDAPSEITSEPEDESTQQSSEEESSAADESSDEDSEEALDESSYVSMTESEAAEASNDGYEFDDEQIVDDYHTAETFTDNEVFNEIFKGNTLDAEYNNELKGASSVQEMRTITSSYANSWKGKVDTAFNALYAMLGSDDQAKLDASQNEWKGTLASMESEFYEEAKSGGSEGLLAADTAVMNYYKGRAAKLLEQIYTCSGSIELSDYGL